jgi:hypothetical protein
VVLQLAPTFIKSVPVPSLYTVRDFLLTDAGASSADVMLEKFVLDTDEPCSGYVFTVPLTVHGSELVQLFISTTPAIGTLLSILLSPPIVALRPKFLYELNTPDQPPPPPPVTSNLTYLYLVLPDHKLKT